MVRDEVVIITSCSIRLPRLVWPSSSVNIAQELQSVWWVVFESGLVPLYPSADGAHPPLCGGLKTARNHPEVLGWSLYVFRRSSVGASQNIGMSLNAEPCLPQKPSQMPAFAGDGYRPVRVAQFSKSHLALCGACPEAGTQALASNVIFKKPALRRCFVVLV